MIKSMTGYGRSESVMGDRKYVVEIKSLNHRYLEISLRMPSVLFSLELDVKKKMGEHFSRGRIEAIIRVDFNNGQAGEGKYDLNLPLIRNYYEMLVKLKQELNLRDDITLHTMTEFRDAFVQSEPNLDVTVIWAELGKVLDEAIVAMKEMRKKEGENLYRDLTLRIDSIERSLDSVALRAPQVVLEYQKRVIERIRELTGGGGIVDELRLSQEVAIMAEKSDMTEEVVRLSSHIHQFSDLIKSDDAVGRKIDFLIQEMVREVNTIGSKSGDLEISRKIVEIKSELAKLREQVQNIE
jgi:uncharacterized protein (TIGR00255 family)